MRNQLFSALLAGSLALGACGGTSGMSSGDPTNGSSDTASESVAIAGFAFQPKTLEIDAGTTVEWVNEDDIAHTVTSGIPKKQGVPGVTKERPQEPDGVFDSGTMELDDTYSFTFDEPGSFTYFCAIHAGMVARVEVR